MANVTNVTKDSEWVKETFQFNEGFKESYNEKNDEGYFLEVDAQYPEKLHELPHNLPFSQDNKLVANLHDKKEYFIHAENLKQMLNRGLVLKKV